MTDTYTPTTEEVREAASLNGAVAIEPDAFDRWLAATVRETAARAWDEGFRVSNRVWEETADLTTPDEDRTDPRNPYREGDPT